MPDLITLLGGALLLSFLHGLIPNHWIPFVLLGRDRGWRSGRMVFVTFLGGTAHLSSTILVGVAIGIAGLALSVRYEAVMRWAAPIILMAAGLWIMARGHGHHHAHQHDDPHAHDHAHGYDRGHDHEAGAPAHAGDHAAGHAHPHDNPPATASDVTTVAALCAMMFLSPCLELEAYYAIAYRNGWLGIASVSAIYLVVTVGVMMTLVALSAKGLGLLRWSFFERNERKISGAVLILLGLAWLAFPF